MQRCAKIDQPKLVRTGGEEPPECGVDTGELILLNRAEAYAFWAWAVTEVFWHTGIRVEKLLELTDHSLAGHHSKRDAPPTASRADSATSTIPGRAALVTRLATLTGLPNQSPARLTANPDATPVLKRGKSRASARAARSSTASRRGQRRRRRTSARRRST
jgi:hypothetical protein